MTLAEQAFRSALLVLFGAVFMIGMICTNNDDPEDFL